MMIKIIAVRQNIIRVKDGQVLHLDYILCILYFRKYQIKGKDCQVPHQAGGEPEQAEEGEGGGEVVFVEGDDGAEDAEGGGRRAVGDVLGARVGGAEDGGEQDGGDEGAEEGGEAAGEERAVESAADGGDGAEQGEEDGVDDGGEDERPGEAAVEEEGGAGGPCG